VQYSYDSTGNRERRTIYYGAYTDYHHDALNRLDTQTSYFNGSTARFDYGFDKVNRIKYEQRNLGAADGFAYDPRNELTGFNQNGTLNANGTVSAAYNVSITYDANGNRVDASDGNNAHYNSVPNNQYASDWSGGLGYDDNANLTARAGRAYGYDAQNRLITVDFGSTHLRYHYDPLNRIVAREKNGAVTTQIWDNWNLIEEREANNAFRRMYFHGTATNEIVASYEPAYGDVFYFQDGRGNVTHLTGPANNVVERINYFVSGQPTFLNGNGAWIPASNYDSRFLFEGALYVPEAEIYDMRNRFYHPNLGRFLQMDPIGLQTEGEKLSPGQKAFFSPGFQAPEAFSSSEMNLYRYCHNDLVDGSDPWGLDTVTIEIIKGSPQVVPDQYVDRARSGADAVTLIAPNGGLVTTTTTDSLTGEIHVLQRITTSTWIKQSLADAGEKDSLIQKENKRVEKFKEGLPKARSVADELAKKGFGTEAAAKAAVEKSTMEVMKEKAREGKIKWDLTGGKH
jgi:RHS repeat-associated protein